MAKIDNKNLKTPWKDEYLYANNEILNA